MKIPKYIACLMLQLLCNSVYSIDDYKHIDSVNNGCDNHIIHDNWFGNGMKLTLNYKGQNVDVMCYTNKDSTCAATIKNVNSVFGHRDSLKISYKSIMSELSPEKRETCYKSYLLNTDLFDKLDNYEDGEKPHVKYTRLETSNMSLLSIKYDPDYIRFQNDYISRLSELRASYEDEEESSDEESFHEIDLYYTLLKKANDESDKLGKWNLTESDWFMLSAKYGIDEDPFHNYGLLSYNGSLYFAKYSLIRPDTYLWSVINNNYKEREIGTTPVF